MHGTINIKYIEAKQAKAIYQFKNSKRKLYRTNAAIWYNKICRQNRLTPDYINIRINGKNLKKNSQCLAPSGTSSRDNLRQPMIVPVDVDTVVLLMMGVCAARNM